MLPPYTPSTCRIGHNLQVHPDPAPAILAESRGLAKSYLEWDGASNESKAALRKGFEKIEGFLEQDGLFTGDDLAIVNYDLNTHNFVVGAEAKLLDWEKGPDSTPHPGSRALSAPNDDALARRDSNAALQRARTGSLSRNT